MDEKKRTISDVIGQVAAQQFVGRDDQLVRFDEVLEQDQSDPKLKCVYNLYGVGGIGKTELLRQLRAKAVELNYPTGWLDLRLHKGTLIGALDDLRRQLGKRSSIENADGIFREFDALSKRRDRAESRLLSRLGKDAEKKGGLVSDILTGTAGGVLGAVVAGPLGAAAVGFGAAASKAALASQSEKLISMLLKLGLSGDDARLLVHAQSTLTSAFIGAISQAAEQAGVLVLLLDTYEEASPVLDEWLRGFISASSSRVLFGIAGRDKLVDMDPTWESFSAVMEAREVETFSVDEATEFLASRGITDAVAVDRLLLFTGRVPWALALAVETCREGSAAGTDPVLATGAQHEIGHRVVRRFLTQIEGTILHAAMGVCCVARRFTAALLSSVLECPDARDLVEQLRAYSFTRVLADGSLSIHDIVRAFMVDEFRAVDPVAFRQTHGKLVKFYDSTIHGEARPSVRKQCLVELLFHSLNADEDKGIELFRAMLSQLDMFTQFDLREDLLSQVSAFEFARPRNMCWQRYCRAYSNMNRGTWAAAERELDALLRRQDLPKLLRCLALDTLGDLYMGRGKYSRALEQFGKSLEEKEGLPPSEGVTRSEVTIGKVIECNAIVGKFSVSVSLANRVLGKEAVAATSAQAWVHKSLGDAYRLWGKTGLAIDSLREALELFRDEGDEYGIASVQTQLGRVYTHSGEWRLAEGTLLAAESAFEKMWVEYGRANVTLFRGNILRMMCEWERALELYEIALAAHREMDARREIGPLLGSMGVVHQKLGHDDEALDLFARSLEMKRAQEYVRGMAVTRIYMGDFHLERGSGKEALGQYRRARRHADSSSSNFHRADSRIGICRALISLGRMIDAEKLLRSARSLCAHYGYSHLMAKLLAVEGAVALGRQGNRAAGKFVSALKYAASYNYHLLDRVLEQIERALREVPIEKRRRMTERILTGCKREGVDQLETDNTKRESGPAKRESLIERLSPMAGH